MFTKPTPTASGELVGYDVAELQNALKEYCNIFKTELQNRVANAESQLINTVKFITSGLNLKIAANEGKVKQIASSLGNIFKLKSLECENNIKHIMARIDANNPMRILGQGYSKMYGSDGLPADIDSVKVGEDITILTNGGKIDAGVKKVIKIKG